jgi:hypothetical protein
MHNANCIEGSTKKYTAFEFSHLPESDLARKRRLLQCPECECPAFFRHASPNRRAACFGARPHAANCTIGRFDLVRRDCEGDAQESAVSPGKKVVVDFGYGMPIQQDFVERSERVSNADFPGFSHAKADVQVSRRVSSLLRTLIDQPAFAHSHTPILIPGRCEVAAKDFFVPLLEVDYRYQGLLRGYWGSLATVRLLEDEGSIWFNSAGRAHISFCLDARQLQAFTRRFGFDTVEGLTDTYILVIGTPQIARNGKLYCLIEDLGSMALRRA